MLRLDSRSDDDGRFGYKLSETLFAVLDRYSQFQYNFRLWVFLVASDPAQDSGAMRIEMARAINTRGSARTVTESILPCSYTILKA